LRQIRERQQDVDSVFVFRKTATATFAETTHAFDRAEDVLGSRTLADFRRLVARSSSLSGRFRCARFVDKKSRATRQLL
jgi:hypothetical protein